MRSSPSTSSPTIASSLTSHHPVVADHTTTSPSSSLDTSSPLVSKNPPQHSAVSPMAAAAATISPPAVTMQNADDHRPDLPRPYKCPLCDKAFHRLEHQTRHIRTHTGEKPHACQFPGCTKRFSRSDELTRHSRIHSNPNARRGTKQHMAQAAAAAIQSGVFDRPSMQQQINPINPSTTMSVPHIHHDRGYQLPLPPPPSSAAAMATHMSPPNRMAHPHHATPPMLPPPPRTTHSAPSSGFNSPNVSPPHTYATYSSTPGSYITRNTGGDISPAQGGYHRQMDINLLATAASQVEREHGNANHQPTQHLPLPNRYSYTSHPYHSHPYHTGRMPSLSSYHYSSNPTSQPMSRSHSHEDDDHYHNRATKKSRPGSPQSTAPPSPEFPHESMSPTPDHTPLATPSHSPRLRPQYFHNGVQLPTLHHLSLQHHPPPALAPVEPSADGHQAYVPVHTGKRLTEIMEAGDGAQRKLPIPIMHGKDHSFTKISELMNPSNGMMSGTNSARASEAGNDLEERN